MPWIAYLKLRNRPEKANAQNERLLDQLDAAFDRAVVDDAVKVIVLRAKGKHFSAGHDLVKGDGSPCGALDHGALKPDGVDADIKKFFQPLDRKRGDSLVAFAWAMAEDLAARFDGK